jgi:uncharacterized protein
MKQKIKIDYRNGIKPRIGIIAGLLFGLLSIAQADLEAGREAYQNEDYETALAELMPLAEEGDMNAQYFMGLMYANGHGLPQDPEEAERWFEKFSNQLDVSGKFNLGIMYYQGKAVPQNYQTAISWFKKAAEEGDAEAQFNLGFIYDNGYGMPQDRQEALKWYRQAADQGLLEAQNNLGVMYSEGQGVPRDYVQAYFWFNVASKQGDKQAAEAREQLAEHMDKTQLAEAIRLTHEWQLASGH